MSRVFAYCRVSTADQTTENQIQEIRAAGFDIAEHRVIQETISGSVKAEDRKGFSSLLQKLEPNDLLVVTKLDRLGRDSTDVVSTVNSLKQMGVSVKCLALGDADLTSSVGQMTMTILAAVAQFERDLIKERTYAGLARAKSEGRVGGRRVKLTQQQQDCILKRLETGAGVRELARNYAVAPSTIMRIRDGLNKGEHEERADGMSATQESAKSV